MSDWTLGGIRIFVQDVSGITKQTIAELNPLRAGSKYQLFGWEKERKKVSAIAVGIDDMVQLRSLTTSGESFELNTPEGSAGNFFVASIEHKRVRCIDQTLRPDLDCDVPVYDMDIELVPDEE